MEQGLDDPRQPLLGRPIQNGRSSQLGRSISKTVGTFCGPGAWRRRVPITIWLPKYSWAFMMQDLIAGVTVGLTSIPQGIAYAIIAGLPPQVGLYSSAFPGIVYAVLGSCKDVIVGPTAILAALVAKYVAVSVDFAYLATFLSGFVILLLGVLQLGFLLDFISKPVISGFTTAAALQIAASQLKPLFRISGKSGNTFISAVTNFVNNIKSVRPWDPLLGFSTIAALVLLKCLSPRAEPGSSTRSTCFSVRQYVVRARNAVVVFLGALLAYCLHLYGLEPLALTGKIDGGLPDFGPPPFRPAAGNHTYSFEGALAVFGAEGLVMPLVAVMESIAIAKAFAGSASVDVTQEMVALGFCNLLSSWCQSMPVTGSFTRTALNHASGVVTPASALFKAALVLLAATQLTGTFYFIPRATLAGVIVAAMAHIVDVDVVRRLYRNTKVELLVYCATVITGLAAGLEYGILVGVGADAARVLFRAARPDMHFENFKVGNKDCTSVSLLAWLSYAGAERVARRLRAPPAACVVLDGRHLRAVDIGVAENLISVIVDIEKRDHRVLFWNFTPKLQKLFVDLEPTFGPKFVAGPSIDQFILGLDTPMNNVTVRL